MVQDLSGQQFGEWKVGSLYDIRKGSTFWACECSCGNVKFISAGKLKNGKSRSCGCKHGYFITQSKIRHNMSNTRIHNIWQKIRARCNPTYHQHEYYYDKGITVCEEWSTFENFYEWAMKNGYKEDLSIDRIDNSKGYSPDNCRWATPLTQACNRDFVYKIPYKDKIYNAKELSKIFKAAHHTITKYAKMGMNGEEIERRLKRYGRTEK